MFEGIIKVAEAMDEYGSGALAEDLYDVDIPVKKRWRQQIPAYIGGGLPGAIGSYVDPERAALYGGIGGAAMGAQLQSMGGLGTFLNRSPLGNRKLIQGAHDYGRRTFGPLAKSIHGMLPTSWQGSKAYGDIRGLAGRNSKLLVGAALGTLGGMYSKKLFERSNPEAMDMFDDVLARGGDPRLVRG